MYSIIPLLTGVRNPDQGIMTYQQGYGKRIWLPVWAFLLKGEKSNILIDTGLDENELFTPASFSEETGMEPEAIGSLLQKEGLSVDDIHIVINTHLHDDHCGNNSVFTNAQFFVCKEEVDFCNSPHPIDHRYDNYFIEGQEFTYIEEEKEIFDGVEILFSPGHTKGCVSVKVETVQGPAVITGFCCNSENFPANGPAVCPGVHLDAIQAWESIQRIKDLGIKIIPMHELSLKRIEG